MKIQINHENELTDVASRILAFTSNERIFLFEGEMGVGKTTLIKSICRQLGINDMVSSPTYSIINEYDYAGGKIFHFDFFRIKTETEAFDLGFEEYLYSGHYCFIEWPEKIRSLWPLHYVEVVLSHARNEERTLSARIV